MDCMAIGLLDNKMNKVIYTIIIGPDNRLREPNMVCPGWEYICYTDRTDLKSDVWNIVNISDRVKLTNNPDSLNWSNRQYSRYLKINYGANFSVYMDARFKPIDNLDTFVISKLKRGYDIALCNHNRRDCIQTEADYLIRHNMINRKALLGQVHRYMKEGYPANYGLWVPNVLIRRHSRRMRKFQNAWWKEYINGCERDMISLAYLMWKMDTLKVKIMQFRGTYNMWMG